MNKNSDFLKRIPLGVKASIGLFVANLISKGIVYLTTPIFTRILNSNDFGKTSLFTTWMTIFGFIAMFCLSAGVFNNGMSDYPDERDQYSFSMLVLSNVITIIFSILLLFIYPFIYDFVKVDFWLVIVMCCVFLLQPAYNFWYTRQRYELKYKNVIVATSISAVASQLLAIFFVTFGKGDKAYLKIIGTEIPLFLFYLFFYFCLFKKSKGKLETKYWKFAIMFNLPLIPHYLSTYLLSSADKIMISNIIGNSATAYYTVAHSIASIALMIWSAINGALLPYIYEKCKRGETEKIGRISSPLIAFFALACFVVILFGPEVIKIMAPAEYYEAIYVIPPIIGGVFFQIQYYLYANVLFYYKKPIYVAIGSITAFVINIFLNYALISKFGYIAAGYTTVLSYLVQAGIDFLAMKHVVKKNIYDMRVILFLSVIIFLIIFIANIIYEFTLIRYVLIIFIFLLLFLFRKQLAGIFKFKHV